jgi:hypothetical protein
MRSQTKPWIAVILRATLIACCWIGVHKGVFPPGGGFMNPEKTLYYTYQSNFWVLILTLIYLALGVVRLVRGDIRIPRALQIARYCVAVAITITFLVYWLMLSPAFDLKENLTLNNQMLHTIVPMLFVADFLLIDRGKPMGRLSALWAAALPLYYFIFSLIYAAVRPEHLYEYGGRYPYFFLNLDKYGWFGSPAGMGVLWWVLILTCGTLLIGYGYRIIQRKTIKDIQTISAE